MELAMILKTNFTGYRNFKIIIKMCVFRQPVDHGSVHNKISKFVKYLINNFLAKKSKKIIDKILTT